MIETVKKPSSKFTNSDFGYTLIETMIALFILAVGILGLLTLSVTSIKMDYKARRMTEGATLNADRHEKLMLTKYDDLALGAEGQIVDGKYTTKWKVSSTCPIPNVKKIEITTEWQENGKPGRPIKYDYYKAETF